MTVTSDLGPYCITPLWLIEATASNPRALQVWVYLNAKYADRETGACWPGRKTIAEALGISVDTLDRALASLAEAGALDIRGRVKESGDRTSNVYRIVTVAPEGVAADLRPGGRMDAATGGRMDAAGTSNQLEPVTKNKEPLSTEVDDGGTPGVELVLVPPAAVPTPERRPRDEVRAAERKIIFEAWVAAVGRNPKTTKMNAKRIEKMNARLNEGYTVDTCVAAVQGIALSRWHMGDNREHKKFDDLIVALRDGAQVEKFAALVEDGGERGRSAVDRAIAMMEGRG